MSSRPFFSSLRDARRWARRPPTPLFWLTGGLMVGQAAAMVAPAPQWRWAAALTALAVRSIARRWPGPASPGPASMVAVALLAAALGHWQVDRLLHPQWAPDHIARLAGARLVVRGRIAERPARRVGGARLVIDAGAIRRGVEWQPAQGRMTVTVGGPTQPWQRGDRFEAVLEPRRPRNFGNPGEFDFEALLARRNVYVTAFTAGDQTWQRTPAVRPSIPSLERWRDTVVQTIEATLDPTTAAIVGALLVGDAIPLAPDVRDRYARAGVSHVLSISGLHVGLVAGAACALLRWLLARSERLLLYANVPKLAMAAGLVPLGLYAAIAGDNVATLRAEIMGVVLAAGMVLDRPREWLAPLAAAALTISLVWPGALCEISFQLSFAAIVAIVIGMRRVTAWWTVWEESYLIRLRRSHWRAVRWLALSEAATVCAMLGTTPLTAWHFNQVSLIGVVANPVIVPLLGVAAVGGGLIATAAVAIAPDVAAHLFGLVGVVVRAADWLVQGCAAIPGASVQVVTPSLLELGLIYGALAALLLRPRRWRCALLAACLVGLAIDAIAWAEARYARTALQITFVSVGQGDCAVVEFPGSAVMVVDGGGLSGSFDVGRQVLGPFLWRRKIAHVDTLVLSHPDFDHFGGLTFLASAFTPDAFWWNGASAAGSRYGELWRALRAADVPALEIHDGFRRIIGGVEVRAVHPGMGAIGGDNDRSLTLQLRYGPTSVLLPGDLEADGERVLVTAHGPTLRSTILKVPHHGSRTSSSAALLNAVAPRIAVLSAGTNNRFGFPHPTVLDAYRRRGIALWRTDRDGAVTIRIGADGTVSVTTGRAGA